MSARDVLSRARQLVQNPWLRRIAQWVIVLVALAYVFHSVVENWQALGQYRQQFDVRYLLGALIGIMLARCLAGLSSQQAFSGLGFSLDASTVFRGYHLSALSLYLPGGLYLGRPVVFGQHGVDAISTSAGVFIEQTVTTLVQLLASLPYLLVVGMGSWSRYWRLGVLLVLPMLIFLHPAIINPVLGWLLRRLGQKDRVVNLAASQLIKMLLFESAALLVSGVASYFLVASVYRVPLTLMPALASAHSLAMFISTVVAITPASLGIHEGVSVFLTSPLLPAPVPALVSILGRLVSTAAVVILFGLAAWLSRYAPPAKAAAQKASSE